MTKTSARLKARMKEIDITQEALAARIGVKRSQVTHYCSGRIPIPSKRMILMEEVLKVPPGWLLYGEEILEKHDTAIPVVISHQIKKFPLLPYCGIIDWVKNGRLPKDCQEITIGILGEPVSKRSFFMQVNGDAMHSKENPQSIENGEYVLVEPSDHYKAGALVVIAEENNDIKIRQYQIDGNQIYFKAFDPQIKHIKNNSNIEIMGEITQVTRFIKKN